MHQFFQGFGARRTARSPGVTLPNVKPIDCEEIALSAKTCLKIRYDKSPGKDLIEYAALNEYEPGIESILSGPLYTSDLAEIEGSRVSVTLLERGQDAQVESLSLSEFLSKCSPLSLQIWKYGSLIGHDCWIRRD